MKWDLSRSHCHEPSVLNGICPATTIIKPGTDNYFEKCRNQRGLTFQTELIKLSCTRTRIIQRMLRYNSGCECALERLCLPATLFTKLWIPIEVLAPESPIVLKWYSSRYRACRNCGRWRESRFVQVKALRTHYVKFYRDGSGNFTAL